MSDKGTGNLDEYLGDGEAMCVVCGKPLLPLSIISSDPYCSTQCCKLDYGVEWTK